MDNQDIPIKYTINDGLASVILNRPEKRNALNSNTLDLLKEIISKTANDKTVKVIVLSGEGKDFCAGADLSALKAITQNDVLENLADAESLMNLFVQMRHLNKPIVAKVHGRALAGGCGLASACDIVLATESSQFGYPEIKIGFIPAMVMALLRRNVSEKRAFDLMALGDPISAPKAQEYGLVNHVFPDLQFENQVDKYLTTLASRSSSALHLMKKLLYQIDGLTYESALRIGADVNVLTRSTNDCKNGIEKFLSSSS